MVKLALLNSCASWDQGRLVKSLQNEKCEEGTAHSGLGRQVEVHVIPTTVRGECNHDDGAVTCRHHCMDREDGYFRSSCPCSQCG